MWLFVLFLAIPLIEIALFIQIGGVIGLAWTLVIVVATAILGTMLVRREGLRALDDLRRAFDELDDPGTPLAHGAMILFAGALLLTPGFFTDAVGFLLLVPQVRAALIWQIARRVRVERFSYGPGPAPEAPGHRPATTGGAKTGGAKTGDVIDGEYEELPQDRHPPDGGSGWTRH